MATLVVAMLLWHSAVAGGKLTIQIDHVVGASILKLDSVGYKNGLGQDFTITMFKYYAGKIRLYRKDGGNLSLDAYYLVDESEPESKRITIDNVPAGEYKGMDIQIGVDSADNCSGAQAGALDPLNAMFWAWNTGYIFLKLEGKSPQSKSTGHILEYHIGGYRSPNNCVRHENLKFKNAIIIANGTESAIRLKADAAAVLQGKEKIDFTKLSSVTDFHNATIIADNYAGMFSVVSP